MERSNFGVVLPRPAVVRKWIRVKCDFRLSSRWRGTGDIGGDGHTALSADDMMASVQSEAADALARGGGCGDGEGFELR
jgi:hypothetical protein